MSATSRTMSLIARSEPSFQAGGRLVPLTVRRSATARAMRLAVDPRDGAVKLTLTRRSSLRAGIAFAEQHRAWIERALDRLPRAMPFAPGMSFPLEGERVTIDWALGHGRSVRREGDRLLVGGPLESLGPRLLRWLKAEALRRLEAETRHYAALAGVAVGRVGVGDPRGRWGSCSASGDLRYSWRLILAPIDVRQATVAHEVAHRLHMNHGPEFHRAVARLLGREPRAENAWLKANGAALHWVGRAAA